MDLTKKKPKLTRVSKTMEEDQFIPKLADVVYDFRAIMAGVDIRTQWARQAAATSKKQSPMGLFYRPAGPQDRQYRPSGRVRRDLNGDGEPELLVMGRKKLLIYNRKGNSLVLKDTLHHSLGEDFIKVSAGDVNGDGSAEIYLVSSIGLRAQSSVWEWSGRFRKVLKMTGHLQV
ncbi:MAG: VCBS repeat-containing protein, partial [Deltaproteobacteria bacterium]|nr:VCBS repeat-containing protein [Deltaproteobacteria bacterium]